MSEVVWYGGLQSVFKWRKIKCSRRSGLIMGTIIRIQRNNIVQQETWVLLADELWTEDNGNDAVCNGNCMRNDYRLRIVRAISMNRELESSMVQCNDRVMITGLPVRLKSRHVDRLTWTYVTIIVVPPQYNNDNNDPCTTLLHGFAERGFNGTMYWTPTNALMDCTLI